MEALLTVTWWLGCPTNVGATGATPSAPPLVVVSDRVEIWVALGCSKSSLSLAALTPALALGQPVTKCTLAMLVGCRRLSYMVPAPSPHHMDGDGCPSLIKSTEADRFSGPVVHSIQWSSNEVGGPTRHLYLSSRQQYTIYDTLGFEAFPERWVKRH